MVCWHRSPARLAGFPFVEHGLVSLDYIELDDTGPSPSRRPLGAAAGVPGRPAPSSIFLVAAV